ncbi:MAG: hypothetical protein LUG56_06550, partial [Lachnospiraceae bacterium]|nr:hypothetical protein [Lachnospiraceae bacterium]
FRIVADYFVQMRKNHDYVPSTEVMNHVEEVLNLMAAVSGDRRFEIAQNEAAERKVSKMEDWLTRRLNKASAETLVNAVESLINKQGLSLADACDTLDYTVEKYLSAKKLLADTATAV